MQLTKQDVGVWVKAGEVNPVVNHSYTIRYKNVIQFISYAYEENSFVCDSDPSCVISDLENVEWLKPVQDVYVLTEDELEEIVESEKEIYKQFLESIKSKS